MTIKYTLIIEGTEMELNEANKKVHHVVIRDPDPYKSDFYISPTIEHKVVEPLYLEFHTELSNAGYLSMTRERQDLLASLAQNKSKKVKVVITEEE